MSPAVAEVTSDHAALLHHTPLLDLGLTVLTDSYGPYGLLARPGSLPAARWPAIYGPAVAVAGIACLGFVLLLTPTGSLPSPRWRWWPGRPRPRRSSTWWR